MKYQLKCLKCGWSSDRFHILCPHCQKASLLKTFYTKPETDIGKCNANFSSYIDWLPIDKITNTETAFDPKIGLFQSEQIADLLHLDHLYILFNGYWPEQNAFNLAGSFKTFEAISVLEKIAETEDTLIISSAGNTARAVIQYSLMSGYRTIVVIPENAAQFMRVQNPYKRKNCFLVTVRDGFYSEAIQTVDKIISNVGGLVREGGVYNVARRDALGVPFIRAAIAMGQLPDHYFQAIGSGTGAIAALEASGRLANLGLVQQKKMRLRLSQNAPFCPVVQAWNSQTRTYNAYEPDEYHNRIEKIMASVLSNNTPPYSVSGGLFDVLSETEGTVDCISNEQVQRAMDLFQKLKSVDLDPAAGVALASLIKAVEEKTVNSDDVILLHLTGGGYAGISTDYAQSLYEPQMSIKPNSDMKQLYQSVETFLD